MNIQKIAKRSFLILMTAVITLGVMILPTPVHAATCQPPATDFGSATITITVPATAVYRLWSRIMAPDTGNNSYLLEVDGTTCYNVGGGTVPTSAWTWIDYQGGTTSSKVQQSLSQGSHTLKLIGNKPGVKVDRIIAISDVTCTPTGLGDDCNKPDDTTPPTVTLTAPLDGAQVSGTTNLTATANDNVGVSKVEFYDNSSLVGVSTAAPYSASWDTGTVSNGSHLITARAYDGTGNISADSNTITIQNGDQQVPTTPTNVSATAPAYNKVVLSWTASTDNIGVAGYTIQRNGAFLTTVGTAGYQDTTVFPDATYNYQVSAYDAAGNKSALSTTATIQTPGAPDAQAPSVPTGLNAAVVSATQINVSWQASTDNIGVLNYDVYRGSTKIATVSSTSFGDTGLQAGTAYTYSVRARDAAGNVSTASAGVTATTQAQQAASIIRGRVTNNLSSPINGARVMVPIGKKNKIVTRTLTDGSYSLTLKSGGRYSVTYSKRGYTPQSLTLTLVDGGILTQNVVLIKK